MRIKNKHLKTLLFAGIIPAIGNFVFMVVVNASNPGSPGLGIAIAPLVFILIGQIIFCIFMFFAYVFSLFTKESENLPYDNEELEIDIHNEILVEREVNSASNSGDTINLSDNSVAHYSQPSVAGIGSRDDIQSTHSITNSNYYKKLTILSLGILFMPGTVLLLRLNSPAIFFKDAVSYIGFIGYLLLLAYAYIQMENVTNKNNNNNSGREKTATIIAISLSIFIGLIIFNTISSAFGGRLT